MREPELPEELELRELFCIRFPEVVGVIEEAERQEAFVIGFELYDMVGLGFAEHSLSLCYNTQRRAQHQLQNATHLTLDLIEARWNMSFFAPADKGRLLFGRDEDRALLCRLEKTLVELGYDENGDSSEDDSALKRLWEVVASFVLDVRCSPQFSIMFPNCQAVILSNGHGEGGELTKRINPDGLPSDFWEGAMLELEG